MVEKSQVTAIIEGMSGIWGCLKRDINDHRVEKFLGRPEAEVHKPNSLL